MITVDPELTCPVCSNKLWVENVDYVNGAVYFAVWCGSENWHLFATNVSLHNVVFHHTVITKASFDRDFTRIK